MGSGMRSNSSRMTGFVWVVLVAAWVLVYLVIVKSS